MKKKIMKIKEIPSVYYDQPPTTTRYSRISKCKSKDSISGGYFSCFFSYLLAPLRWIKSLFVKIFSCFKYEIDIIKLATEQVEELLGLVKKFKGAKDLNKLINNYKYKYSKLLSYVAAGLEATASKYFLTSKFHKEINPIFYKKDDVLNLTNEIVKKKAKELMRAPLHELYHIELVLEDYLKKL